jgi:hypothetical protein
MVAKIFLDDHFLCLSLNPTTLSHYSPNKKGLEKEKNKDRYRNVLSSNSRGWSSNI